MEATDILILRGLKLTCEDREASSSFYNILNGLFIGKGSCSGVLDIFGFEILAWRRKSSINLVPLLPSATYCHCLIQHGNTQWCDCHFVGARLRVCCWLSLYTQYSSGGGVGWGLGGRVKDTNLDGLKMKILWNIMVVITLVCQCKLLASNRGQ